MPNDQAQRSDLNPLDIARQAELLELTQDAILVRDLRSSAVTYWNAGAERLYGWLRAEALGQVTHTLLQTQFPHSLAAVNQALESDSYWEGELVHSRRDGATRVVSSRQAVQRDADGRAVAILEINTDITERKRADEERVRLATERRARQIAERALDHLARLQRVTAGLSEAQTPLQVATVVMEQGIPALDAARGRICLVREATGDVEVLAASGYTSVRSPFRLDERLPTNTVIATGQPLFVSTFIDLIDRYPGLDEFVEPIAGGALASAPLFVQGHVVGAMTLAFSHDRDFDPDDRQLLLALAAQCGQALERAGLYAQSLVIQEDLRRSRDQLTAILGGIAEGVTVQDTEGRLIYANDIAAKLTGFDSARELRRASPRIMQQFDLFDEAGDPFPVDNLPGRRLLRGEAGGEVVVQFRDAGSGDWRWALLDAAPVQDAHGRLQLVVNIFRDVTERKQRTEATEFLAAASTVLGSTLDVTSSLKHVAQLAVSRIADWCSVELVGDDGKLERVAVAQANPDEGEPAEPRSRIVARLVARGQMFGTLTLATSAVGRRYGQLDYNTVGDLALRAALAIDTARLFREIQAQAHHQAVLNASLRETVEQRDKALADLQQALRTRDEFLASASHDLKNPLASIKATSQLLSRRLARPGPIDADRLREGLRRMDAIATRAAGLVDELLDVARMQMGRPLDLDRHPADLVGLVREAVAEHQQVSERHAVRFESQVDELVATGDARRIGRVLANLLDNAIKYSPEGGPIVVRLSREGDWASIQVADRGIGIPAGEIGRVFERFQRASNVERRIGGTGLGLASARHIVESHGGHIAAESREGDGATFTVRLPLAAGVDAL